MKHVLSDRIVCIDDQLHDDRYLFDLPTDISLPHMVDMAELLAVYRDDRIEYRSDYKRWNQVYAPEKELELFRELVDRAVSTGVRVHIENISLREEVEIIRELYYSLGYFDAATNRFWPDFARAPVTIGVNIHNLIYSTKDYKSKRDAICFIPPPREPGHVKHLFAGVNCGAVSTIRLSGDDSEEGFLCDLILGEKTSLLHLSNALYWNYHAMGVMMGQKEWIL